MLGELFPNIAAAFNVGMIEPKFEKEIQSSFSLRIKKSKFWLLSSHLINLVNLDLDVLKKVPVDTLQGRGETPTEQTPAVQ